MIVDLEAHFDAHAAASPFLMVDLSKHAPAMEWSRPSCFDKLSMRALELSIGR